MKTRMTLLCLLLSGTLSGNPVKAPWYMNPVENCAWVRFHQMNLQDRPALEGKVLAVLAEGERVTLLKETGGKKFKITLRGTAYEAPFVRIKRQDGTSGWIFAASLAREGMDASTLYNNESFNGLKPGLDTATVLRILGQPAHKGKAGQLDADARIHQGWEYPARGIIMDIVLEKERQWVFCITIRPPCPFKSRRGMGIGSMYAAVYSTYMGFFDDASFQNRNSLIVGSMYGGLTFTFTGNKVSSIYFGPTAW